MVYTTYSENVKRVQEILDQPCIAWEEVIYVL